MFPHYLLMLIEKYSMPIATCQDFRYEYRVMTLLSKIGDVSQLIACHTIALASGCVYVVNHPINFYIMQSNNSPAPFASRQRREGKSAAMSALWYSDFTLLI